MTGARTPTLKDVARRAGVHPATASRALRDDQSHLVNDETRVRVRSAADALGYRGNAVAQSLRIGRTGSLGVIVADLANPFIVTLLRGIEHGLRATPFVPLVTETHDDPQVLRAIVSRLLRSRVDGIILSAALRDDESFVDEIEQQVPVVLAVRGFGGTVEDGSHRHLQVLQDDNLGAATAANHLIEIGHRRLAELPGPEEISSFFERSHGFRRAVGSHPGISDLSTGDRALEPTIFEGRRLMTDLLRRSDERRPTAVFAHNDLLALGAMDAVREAGLHCPADMSIVGYNDLPLVDRIDVPLTTVRLPAFELGRHAARLMVSSLTGGASLPEQIVLGPQFVERDSTRPPPR